MQLTLALGISNERLFALISDTSLQPPPSTAAAAASSSPALSEACASPAGTATRGELLASRFRAVLLPHLASESSYFGPELLASRNPHLLVLLIALLQYHVATPEAPAEPLVRSLCAVLPSLLSSCRWPHGLLAVGMGGAGGGSMDGAGSSGGASDGSASRFDGILSLLRLLLLLGGHIAAAPRLDSLGAPSPSVLVDAVTSLLLAASKEAASSTDPIAGKNAERGLVECLKLTPLLLRFLKPTAAASNGLTNLVAVIRSVLAAQLPLSFTQQRDEDHRRRASAILTPLLDAVADRQAQRCSTLLLDELLSAPGINEQPLHGKEPHPFTDGLATATGHAVEAAIASPPTDDADGASSATRLWQSLCRPSIVTEPAAADGAKGRWSERVSRLRWVGLPLLLSAPPQDVLSGMLCPCIFKLFSLLKAAGAERGSCTWLGDAASTYGTTPAMLHANLARVTIVCEVFGCLIGRLGNRASDALKPQGELSIALDAAASKPPLPGTDYFKELVANLKKLSTEPLRLPALGAEHATKDAKALAAGAQAAAYAALCEASIQTQTRPSVIEKCEY